MNPDTDRWVRSAEAQAKFRDLLDDVEDGAHVYVLRYDKPAAVLVPVEWFEGSQRQLSAIRALLAAFDWESDDRQHALEGIEQIMEGGE